MKVLKAESLTLTYGDEPVVEELDLIVPPGQITALVGPNGCGKSTLLRGLSRLMKPRAGTVYLDGKAIHTMATKEVAQQVGVLPQSPLAPEGLTVRELVSHGRYPHQSWLQQPRPEDEQAIEQALKTTNMMHLAERPLDTLSGGQRQRAWIAMALAQETEILLLDEPTTFLDLAYQLEVLDLLHQLNAQGRTIVMVLHDLNQASRYAHHIVALKDGRIHAQGQPGDVVTTKMVRDVFGVITYIVADPVTGTPMCVPASRPAAQVNGHSANGNGCNGHQTTPVPATSTVLTDAG